MATFLGEDDSVLCTVVVNDRGQYSIWPADRSVPTGWKEIGFKGPRNECLSHIEIIWSGPTLGTTTI